MTEPAYELDPGCNLLKIYLDRQKREQELGLPPRPESL